MKLFMIGNGFDIAHEIPCKYWQFYEYLNESQPDILEAMQKFYYVESDSALWSDFETSLESDINYETLTEIIGENSPNFGSDDFREGDWYDAEISVKHECDNLLATVRSGFQDWIQSLEISQVNIRYNLSPNDYYITFNYTEVLEDIYNIPVSQILHIHNKVGEELIFGHGKNVNEFNVRKALYGDENAFLTKDEYGNIESSETGHEQFAENAVLTFYNKMRKHTENVIENHNSFFKRLLEVEEIIVMGHSYNNIDFPYFKKIAESVSNETNWTLCYFSSQDKTSAEEIMSQLSVDENLQEYKDSSTFYP